MTIRKSYLLPDQDSNLDKQNQNLSYYHYTIGQSPSNAVRKWFANIASSAIGCKNILKLILNAVFVLCWHKNS